MLDGYRPFSRECRNEFGYVILYNNNLLSLTAYIGSTNITNASNIRGYYR